MGKFRQFLTELSARYRSVLSCQGDNFSKSQWIFTKLDMRIYLRRSGLDKLMGKFHQFLSYLAATR